MGNGKIDIIATINTHKIDKGFLSEIVENGATIIRLNGAHIQKGDLNPNVDLIRKSCGSGIKIMVDLPGTKIRTEGLFQKISLKIGETFVLNENNFNFPRFINYVSEGDIVISSDGQLKMRVDKIDGSKIFFAALCNGELLNHKGVHLQTAQSSNLPFFSDKDYELIDECKTCEVNLVGLSFVRSSLNIEEAQSLLKGTRITPIVKLETREATNPENIREILARAEYFLIDRGDLASEVGLLDFPRVFNETLETALANNKKVFIATQLFASMCDRNLPYLSEIIEFYRLINLDIAGIQLSEEIAIGQHPLEILELIQNLIKRRAQ